MYSLPERSTPCSVTTLPAEFTSWFPWTWIDRVDVAAATRTPNPCAKEATASAAMATPTRCFTTHRVGFGVGERPSGSPGLEVVCSLAIPPGEVDRSHLPVPLRWWALLSGGLLPRRYRFL
jgi:hypothetical protein